MAYMTKTNEDEDETLLSEDNSIARSFLTMHVTDPFATALGEPSVEIYPNAKKNLLDDLNSAGAEQTMLPPPPQKENIEVYLRVKPKTAKEKTIATDQSDLDGGGNTVSILSNFQVDLLAPKESQTFKNSVNGVGKMKHHFTFSKIIRPEVGQKEIFSSLVQPKLQDFLEGQNQLLFTYGATSAGKTFTMQGEPGNSGIIPRSIDLVFNTIGSKVCQSPVQPFGFNRVVAMSQKDLDLLRKEKESVFRLGLDLKKRSRPPSPDTSVLSGCSAASTGSSVASGFSVDLANLHSLFPSVATRDREEASLDIKDDNINYSVWVSFVEIYNENCHDLLVKVTEGKKKGDKAKRTTLRLGEDKDGLPYVKGLKEIPVASADEAYQVLITGRENLHFAATKLNQQSSRSHCIFSLKILRVADPERPHLARVSMFSFCDLAGSERISKTNNVGERQKEAGNINTSLLILGRCIKAMRHNQTCKDKKGQEMVPFRESKLTRLFKSYLTGQGKSSLITCISQAEYLFDETVHVCKFASIASKVTIETIREPPVQKKPISSRFSEMMDREKSKLLSLASNASVLGRSSIAWEMPPPRGKKSSSFGCFKPNARSTIAPGSLLPPRMSTLMNISEIQDVEDETVLENTVVQAQYEGLLKLVEDLKTKLIDERKKNLSLEKNLREELCNEFNQMLVEVEKGYEQRMQDQIADAEKANEWRIGEINNVHSKRNKRKRENDSGDFGGEELEIIRLQAQLEEKTKAETVLGQEVEDLQQQVTAMKDATLKSKQEQDKLQAANSKVQFELAEQQRLAAELGRELANTEAKLVEERRNHKAIRDGETDALLESERQLAETREALEKMENDVSDLKELIQEAGDDFIMKDEELQEAQKECKERESQVAQQGFVIQDLQGQLEECHVLLQEVNNQLEDKEKKIEELEQEAESLENDKSTKLQARVVELEDELRLTKSQYLTADDLSTELKENLEAAEKTAEEERARAKEAEEKMLEAQQERNQLLTVKSKLLQEIAEIRTRKGSGSNESDKESDTATTELRATIENLTGLNKVLTESNEGLRLEKEESQSEIQYLKLKIDELKAATSVDESLFEDEEDIRQQVSSLNSEVVSLKDSLSSAKTEMETLKSEKRRLLSQIESQEEKTFDEFENIVEKVATLEDQLRREKENYESKVKSISDELTESVSKVEKTEKCLKDLKSEIAEKESLLKNLEEEKEKLKGSYENSRREVEATFEKERRELETKQSQEIETKEKKISELENELKENRKSKSVKDQEVSMNVINLETRNGSLEKELATKDNYIKELEDVIVEKEFRISELEQSSDENDGPNEECLKEEIAALKDSLKKEAEERSLKEEKIQKLNLELSDMAEKVEHQEKMKEQRESLEKSVKDCQKLSESLSNLEEDLRNTNIEKKKLVSKLESSEKLVTKLKEEVNESKGEIKALKKATKESAKEALEVSEVKSMNDDLKKENDRLQSIVKAEAREQNALDLLKSELAAKSSELSALQEKVELLRTELGGKDKELSQTDSELEKLRHEAEAREYDLNKARDERTNLMEHYEKQFKMKQAEIDSLKAAEKEKLKMEEILAKATPSKSLGDTKDKLSKAQQELKETKEKLSKEEEEVITLKKDLKSLHIQIDNKQSQHEREMKRAKLASDKVIAEYRETNKQLQRRVEVSVTPASPQDPSPTLEADDSKTDTSLIESTPLAKRRPGARGRGRGRATRSNASLASFEDSNTENEPEAGRPRVASVSRKSRVTRASKSVLADMDGEEEKKNRSVSRKRVAATRSESSVLKEKQLLSPVPEGEKSAETPAQKKKRKLYSQTPQHSQVFTPPTDLEQDTPGSVVKKQLRTRRAKKT